MGLQRGAFCLRPEYYKDLDDKYKGQFRAKIMSAPEREQARVTFRKEGARPETEPQKRMRRLATPDFVAGAELFPPEMLMIGKQEGDNDGGKHVSMFLHPLEYESDSDGEYAEQMMSPPRKAGEGEVHHSSFLAGKCVHFAGELSIGRWANVIEFNGNSGHYLRGSSPTMGLCNLWRIGTYLADNSSGGDARHFFVVPDHAPGGTDPVYPDIRVELASKEMPEEIGNEMRTLLGLGLKPTRRRAVTVTLEELNRGMSHLAANRGFSVGGRQDVEAFCESVIQPY